MTTERSGTGLALARAVRAPPLADERLWQAEPVEHARDGMVHDDPSAERRLEPGVGRRSLPCMRLQPHQADPRVGLVRLKSHAGETAASDAGLKAALGRWVVVNHTIARVLDRLGLPQTLVGEWRGTNRPGQGEPGA